LRNFTFCVSAVVKWYPWYIEIIRLL